MPVYTSHLLSLAETYIRLCECRSKLDKCPNVPRTKRLKARLDALINDSLTRPERAHDGENWRKKPIKLTGFWRVRENFMDYIESWSDPRDVLEDVTNHLLETEPLDPEGDWALNNPYGITIVDMG